MGFYKNTNSGAHNTKKYLIKDYVARVINSIAHTRMEIVDIDVFVDDNFVVTVSNRDLYSHTLEDLIAVVHRSKVSVDVGGGTAGVYFMESGYSTIVEPMNPTKYIFRLSTSVIDEIMTTNNSHNMC